jgi:Na+/alanine symporter
MTIIERVAFIRFEEKKGCDITFYKRNKNYVAFLVTLGAAFATGLVAGVAKAIALRFPLR